MTAGVKKILSILFLSCLIFSLSAVLAAKGKAKADAPAYFYMTDGAYIRPTAEGVDGAEDQNGIRFETNLSETFAASAAEECGFIDYSVEYFTLIGKNVAISDLVFDNVGDNGGNKIIKKTWTPSFDDDGACVRYTDLLNYPEDLFATAFTVRSGIRFTQAGKAPVSVYATGADLTRTMEGCAIAAIADDSENFNDFKKYIGLGDTFADDFSVDGTCAEIEVFGHTGESQSVAVAGLGDKTGASIRIYEGARLVDDGTTVDEDGNLVLSYAEIAAMVIDGVEHTYFITDTTNHKIYSKTVICTYTESATDITITETKIVGLNRDENLTVDLSSLGTFDTEDILFATFNGKDISASVSDNALTVANGAFSDDAGAADDFVVELQGGYTVTVPLKIVHYAIGDADELDGFRLGALKKSNTNGVYNNENQQQYVYAVLTDNVDASSLSWTSDGYFCGSFDGQGYTVSNISTSSAAIFFGLKGRNADLPAEIKNVSFINIEQQKNDKSASLLVANVSTNYRYATIGNVYIQGKFKYSTNSVQAGITHSSSALTNISNVIVDVQYKVAKSKQYGVSGNAVPSQMSNVFVIDNDTASDTRTTFTYNSATPSGCGVFASTDAFIGAINNETVSVADFDSAYWDCSGGYPVWKTAAWQE